MVSTIANTSALLERKHQQVQPQLQCRAHPSRFRRRRTFFRTTPPQYFALGLILVLDLSLRMAGAAQVREAVAYLYPGNKTFAPNVAGFVTLVQNGASDLDPVTVDVSGLTGVPAGWHGFHIHQFGDTSTSGPGGPGGHFIPVCGLRRRRLDNVTSSTCAADQTHGLPPSPTRNPGDMGNLYCSGSGCVICFDGEDPTAQGTPCAASRQLGQQKMSLSHSLRSVLGRAVALHMYKDRGNLAATCVDGTGCITSIRGIGDAGPAFAYGTIGMTRPGVGDSNIVAVPRDPPPSAAVCIFNSDMGIDMNRGIAGKAMIVIDERKRLLGHSDFCSMRAEITGLDAGTKSFHFHTYGDLRYVDDSDAATRSNRIGDIYSAQGLAISTIDSDSVGKAVLETTCSMSSMDSVIGRTLSIHAAETATSATIALSVCGIANDATCFEDATTAPMACNLQVDNNAPPEVTGEGAVSSSHAGTMLVAMAMAMAVALQAQ